MSKDIVGNNINVGDTVVAPFGKTLSAVCEVKSIRAKTCLVVITNCLNKGMIGQEYSKHSDSIVVINSVSNKLDALGF